MSCYESLLNEADMRRAAALITMQFQHECSWNECMLLCPVAWVHSPKEDSIDTIEVQIFGCRKRKGGHNLPLWDSDQSNKMSHSNNLIEVFIFSCVYQRDGLRHHVQKKAWVHYMQIEKYEHNLLICMSMLQRSTYWRGRTTHSWVLYIYAYVFLYA